MTKYKNTQRMTMTSKDDITRMARKARINNDCDGIWCDADQLKRFAALVAAAEREACAKVCEEWGAWNNVAQDCAAAIRARGKQ